MTKPSSGWRAEIEARIDAMSNEALLNLLLGATVDAASLRFERDGIDGPRDLSRVEVEAVHAEAVLRSRLREVGFLMPPNSGD